MDPFYLGAYWGSRRESSLRCGERLTACVARLAEIDEAFGSWFKRGARKTAAKTPVHVDSESFGRLLAQGVNRRDADGEVIEDLGFSIGLWNRARPAVGMSCAVGAQPSTQGVLNSVVFDFPPPEGEALRLYEPRIAEAIIDAVVEEWEPKWATWISPTLRCAQSASRREPVIGWMTYLAKPVHIGIPGTTTRSLLGGSVVRIGWEVSDADETVVLDVRRQLAKIGGLIPIP